MPSALACQMSRTARVARPQDIGLGHLPDGAVQNQSVIGDAVLADLRNGRRCDQLDGSVTFIVGPFNVGARDATCQLTWITAGICANK